MSARRRSPHADRFRRLARSAARGSTPPTCAPDDVVWSARATRRLAARRAPAPRAERQAGASRARAPSSSWPSERDLHRDPGALRAALPAAVAAAGEPGLLDDRRRPDCRAGLELMARSVRRDIHKMHAFVRFREVADGGRRRALRRLVRAGAPHRRAAAAVLRPPLRRHALVDPDAATRSLHWDGEALDLRPRRQPARRAGRRCARGALAHLLRRDLQPGAAEAAGDEREMPQALLAEPARGRAHSRADRDGARRTETMVAASRRRRRRAGAPPTRRAATSRRRCAERHASRTLRRRLAACRALPLCRTRPRPCRARGPPTRRSMLVGEQPGDQEDLAGRPFVGPAGQVLDRALAEAGIDRAARLRHQRGEALQARAARQAAHPQDARRRRGRRLPLVAGQRARAGPAEADRGAGRHRRAGAAGQAPSPIGTNRGRPLPLARRPPAASPSTRPTCCACPTAAAKGEEYAAFVADLALAKEAVGAWRPTGHRR